MSDSNKNKDGKFLRPIRSFVLREGRLTAGQKRALESAWPEFGLAPKKLESWPEVFGNDNPVCLEIGFGMGKSLVEQAQATPEENFVGVEVHTPGIGACLNQIQEHSLTNLRLFHHDAVEVVKSFVPSASLNRIQVFFPDPWHKKKHHKRRLIQAPFLDSLISLLRPSGVIHLATDWENYAEQMLSLVNASPRLANQSPTNEFVERPAYRPLTKFEKRGQRLGHGVWDIIAVKQDGSE